MKERVQKLMAQANVASRRAAEELIRQGRVTVNGRIIQLGDQADPAVDTIEVDGTRLRLGTDKRYFALNKPLYVVSSNVSQDDRENVRDLIPYQGHLFTVGRLDAESDGLMVLTNDGDLANQLSHPRYEHTKTYKVVVYGNVSQDTLDRWEKGVYLEEGLTAPCSIRVQQRDADVTVLRIVMIEGKKRQIRRVAAMLEHPVKRLTRTHIGKLELGKMRAGEWRELGKDELELLTTPASDLSYIRRLRREQRAIKRRDYRSQQLGEQKLASRQALSELEQALNKARPGSRLRVSRISDDEDDEKRRRRTAVGRRPAGSARSSGSSETDRSDRRPTSRKSGDSRRPADSTHSSDSPANDTSDRRPVSRKPAGNRKPTGSRPTGSRPTGSRPAGGRPGNRPGGSKPGSSRPGGRKPSNRSGGGGSNKRDGGRGSGDNRRGNDKRRSSR